MKVCERIYEAGAACGDMGWNLVGCGRKREGNRWCDFGRLLADIAWEVEEEDRVRAEEEKKRAGTRAQRYPGAEANRWEVVEIE